MIYLKHQLDALLALRAGPRKSVDEAALSRLHNVLYHSWEEFVHNQVAQFAKDY